VFKFLTCVLVDHDWRLELVAAAVCVTATLTAFRLYGLAVNNTGALRHTWIALTGVTGGCGIWATHFIAMLAYRPRLATGYEPVGTVLSLILSVLVTSLGFGLAARGRTARTFIVSGAILGLGIAVMHYTGMAAFRTQGVLIWSVPYLVASVLISMLLSVVAFQLADSAPSFGRQAIGGGLFTLAICGMHFTGMTAVTILPDPTITVPDQVLHRGAMAATLTGLAAIIGLTGLGASLVERCMRSAALAQLRFTIDAMPNGVALFDAHDRFVLWNARYAEIFGVNPGRLKPGLSFRALLEARLAAGEIPDAVGDEAGWLEQRLKDHAARASVREQRTAADRWARVQEARTSDGGSMTVCVDLSDMRRNNEALARARDEAEAANHAKSHFLANMSHELRTPLNGVIAMADLLAAAPLGAREQEIVKVIRSSGDTLEHLVSDLLDFGRIEEGKLVADFAPFDLSEAVCTVVELCSLKLETGAVVLKTDIAPEAKAWFDGDVGRLKQILTNLLSNAIKFTNQGEIRVTVSAPAAEGFVVTVSDTGIGFDASVRDRIFGRFEQADASMTRRYGGSGLGLAISRRLAELLGGELSAQSEPGRGSTFTLSLPLRRVEPTAFAEAQSSPTTVISDRPLRVLLAEDHPVNRNVVELILAGAGVELTSVENGAEAVSAFEHETFDLVLMDMMMPVMDGLTATRAIRAFEHDQARATTPVVMLTANALREHVDAALEAGADAHVSKPVTAQALIDTIVRLTAPADARNAAAA
jgi:signal transduction histidine kinase/NO-binding membrane sensor protein with MHYT domain/CheY-like chemotaxis protein